jgi:hypothetical protein
MFRVPEKRAVLTMFVFPIAELALTAGRRWHILVVWGR